jgi:hypothetical protein
MRRITAATALLTLVLTMLFASSAAAGNPHFVGTATPSINTSGQLAVSFRIAGLGSGETVDVSLTATGTAAYGCQNKGGNFPSDPKKTEQGQLGTSTPFTSDRNGNVRGTVYLGPLPTTLDCPGGQTEVLIGVTYTNVMISFDGASGSDSQSIPGTFSKTYTK